MRKRISTLAIALGVAMGLMVPAGAASLHEPHTDMSFDCDGTVTLHFVNNQTDGAAAADITVYVNGTSVTIVDGPTKVNRNVQHYHIDIDGSDTLHDASTPLPGRLVLSDYECTPDKKKD